MRGWSTVAAQGAEQVCGQQPEGAERTGAGWRPRGLQWSAADADSTRPTVRQRRRTIGGAGHGLAEGPKQQEAATARPRRASLGSGGVLTSSTLPGGTQREWVTTRSTEWRVAARADSGKIGDLPPGRKLIEIPSARSFPGWCPIAPRGWVSLDDIAPVQAAELAVAVAVSLDVTEDSPPAAAGVRSHAACVQPPDAEEAQLREQQLAVQQELKALQREREAVASELGHLRQQRAEERGRLEHCRQQRGRLEEKLRRCSDVVALTVSSMDRLHSLGEEELLEGDSTAQAVQADVMAAGAAVQQTLSSIAEGEEEEEREVGTEASEDKENESPRGALRAACCGAGNIGAHARLVQHFPRLDDAQRLPLQPRAPSQLPKELHNHLSSR